MSALDKHAKSKYEFSNLLTVIEGKLFPKARLFILQKLIKRVAVLRVRKGSDGQKETNIKRSCRLVEEIQLLKKWCANRYYLSNEKLNLQSIDGKQMVRRLLSNLSATDTSCPKAKPDVPTLKQRCFQRIESHRSFQDIPEKLSRKEFSKFAVAWLRRYPTEDTVPDVISEDVFFMPKTGVAVANPKDPASSGGAKLAKAASAGVQTTRVNDGPRTLDQAWRGGGGRRTHVPRPRTLPRCPKGGNPGPAGRGGYRATADGTPGKRTSGPFQPSKCVHPDQRPCRLGAGRAVRRVEADRRVSGRDDVQPGGGLQAYRQTLRDHSRPGNRMGQRQRRKLNSKFAMPDENVAKETRRTPTSEPPRQPPISESLSLHPSWRAKKRSKPTIAEFTGTRTVIET